jgi:hypothetical protein
MISLRSPGFPNIGTAFAWNSGGVCILVIESRIVSDWTSVTGRRFVFRHPSLYFPTFERSFCQCV